MSVKNRQFSLYVPQTLPSLIAKQLFPSSPLLRDCYNLFLFQLQLSFSRSLVFWGKVMLL